VQEIFRSLKDNLKLESLSTSVGDEGGFAPNLKSTSDAIEIIIKSIRSAGYRAGENIFLSLDAASSEFYKKNSYNIEPDEPSLSKEELVDFYDGFNKQISNNFN
jgi:enolase